LFAQDLLGSRTLAADVSIVVECIDLSIIA
jgi:hypothetical protein